MTNKVSGRHRNNGTPTRPEVLLLLKEQVIVRRRPPSATAAELASQLIVQHSMSRFELQVTCLKFDGRGSHGDSVSPSPKIQSHSV